MDKEKLYTQKNKKLTPKVCLIKMLSLVGKEGCQESENKIAKAIGCFDDGSKIVEFTDMDYFRISALSHLREYHIKNQAKNSISYDKFFKKVSSFRNSLKKSAELMKDKTIKELLTYKANHDPEIPPRMVMEDYAETYRRIHLLFYEMEWALSPKRNKGRPSLDILCNYVYKLAVLYKELSKENLSILRHKGEEGEYKPVTDGHGFIYIAIQLLNEDALKEGYNETYTDKNIYNACENIQKRLRLSSKKPR